MGLKVVNNSIVFDHNDPDFLDRTFAAGDDATRWTLSFWVKRGIGVLNSDGETIFSAGTGVNDNTKIVFNNNGTLSFRHEVATVVVDNVGTQIRWLEDPTTWYHIVVAYDTNEAVAQDRVRIWSNNRLLQNFNPSNFPTSAATSFINTAVEHRIGSDVGALTLENRGYLAEVVFVDGTALTPSSFAELNEDSWQPTDFSPTFGTNGFALEFETAAALGDDTSGNTNDFTQNSITTANQREDTPSQNHLTLNPLRIGTAGFPDAELHFGNRQLIAGDTNIVAVWATAALPKTGKYYWEVDCTLIANADECAIGVVSQLGDPGLIARVWQNNHGWALRNSSGTVLEVAHDLATLSTFTDTGTLQTGDYVQIAYDTATRRLWFGVNGTFLDSGDPGAGTNPAITFAAGEIFGDVLIPAIHVSGTVANQLDFRAGTEDLEGSIPTGFVTLRVDDWPDPVITKPSDHFTFLEWQGDNTSPRAIAGADFQPDLAWVKQVDAAGNHIISDIIKGAGTVHRNNATTIADDAAHATGEISVFETDGISVQDGGSSGVDVNLTGEEYVALLWKESVLAGLDLVGYTGVAAPANFAHSLGVIPDFMYVRNRDTISDNEVYFGRTIDGTGETITDPETDSVQANTTAALTDSAAPWDDTAPDASFFRVGSATSTNANNDDHQAYLWAEVEGFSKIGGYVGTGVFQQDAPFIYCGFRPKMVLIKRLDAVDDWALFLKDSLFRPFNIDHDAYQHAWQFWRSNLAEADVSPGNPGLVICGSGFAIKQSSTEFNTVGEYAFIAFAEVPFKHASAGVPPLASFGDGVPDLKLQIDATGDLPIQHGDGAPEIALVIDATGDLPNQHGDGDLNIAIDITATGINVNRHGAGALDLLFEVDATADYVGEFGDGAMDLAIEIDGAGSNPGKHGAGQIFLSTEIFSAAESGDDGGSISMPQLQTNGVIVGSFPMIGEARIPQLQVEAVLDNANTGIASAILIPKLQTQGEINGSAGATLPLLQVLGTMVPGRTYTGTTVTIPFLQVVGAGDSPQPISGNLRLPQLRTLGTLVPGAVITENELGGLVLPQLQVEGFLFIPNLGTGSVLLPALDIDPLSFIAAGSIGGGSVTLPFVRVEGIIVNGVTLASTVWVMNTETFETTNYLNFDFDSLVSFNEQPYGVTSSGIFLLEGDDDDGTNIDARILTGISDRGDENLKEVVHLYAQGEFQALILQLFPDGQARIREYDITRVSNSSGIIHARAKGARGLRSRSWQMGFRNSSGSDFTIDKLGLLIRKLVRKTRKN